MGHVFECKTENGKSLGVYTVPLVFDTLSERLQGALGDLRKRGKLDDEAVSRAMRDQPSRNSLVSASVSSAARFVSLRRTNSTRAGFRKSALRTHMP